MSTISTSHHTIVVKRFYDAATPKVFAGRRTEVTVTDQLVILDGGDTRDDRERGWGETLDKLPPVL